MKRQITPIFIVCACFMTIVSPLWGAEKLSLMLDWFPNIDHLPLFVAQEKGIFDKYGLDISILSPAETADPLKLAASGHVDLAIAYEPQAIMAASEGIPIKVVGRLIGHPLSTLLFIDDKDIREPSDLEGKNIGYTVPGMMDFLTDGFARKNNVKNYKLINVGFSILPSLTTGKVDAVMGPYKNYEVVELEQHGYKAGYFELEKYGIPDYDELVFISGEKNLQNREKAIATFCQALQEAIEETRRTPQESLDLYLKAVPEAEEKLEFAALEKTLHLFAENQSFDKEKWQEFANFALSIGMIGKEVNVYDILWNRK